MQRLEKQDIVMNEVEEGEHLCVKYKFDLDLELKVIERYDFDNHRMPISVVLRNYKGGKYYGASKSACSCPPILAELPTAVYL